MFPVLENVGHIVGLAKYLRKEPLEKERLIQTANLDPLLTLCI